MSNRGGSSRCTSKKHLPKQTCDQSNSRAASRGDQKEDQAIDHKGETLQETRSTGKKDLHQEPSGAGIVGKRVIDMTTFAPGAEALNIKV